MVTSVTPVPPSIAPISHHPLVERKKYPRQETTEKELDTHDHNSPYPTAASPPSSNLNRWTWKLAHLNQEDSDTDLIPTIVTVYTRQLSVPQQEI
jgi:hypothetical protein